MRTRNTARALKSSKFYPQIWTKYLLLLTHEHSLNILETIWHIDPTNLLIKKYSKQINLYINIYSDDSLRFTILQANFRNI